MFKVTLNTYYISISLYSSTLLEPFLCLSCIISHLFLKVKSYLLFSIFGLSLLVSGQTLHFSGLYGFDDVVEGKQGEVIVEFYTRRQVNMHAIASRSS